VQPGILPQAWSEKGRPPPASVMQVCIEQGPASPHSAFVAHSCGRAMLHEGRHVPAVDVVEDVTKRQQRPVSPQEVAEVHELLPEFPESSSE
jgi:hypothetical protein